MSQAALRCLSGLGAAPADAGYLARSTALVALVVQEWYEQPLNLTPLTE